MSCHALEHSGALRLLQASLFRKREFRCPRLRGISRGLQKAHYGHQWRCKTDVYGFGMRGAKGGQEPWGSFIWARAEISIIWRRAGHPGHAGFHRLYRNGYAPPTAPMDGFNEIIANFKSGKTAMTVHHIGSSIGMVDTFGDDVDAFPFPGGVGQWTSMGDTENILLASSKNKEAAFEWLAYLATGKGQEAWCVATGNVPVSRDVQQLPFFRTTAS